MSLRNDNSMSESIARIALVALYMVVAIMCLGGLFEMTTGETIRLVIGIAFASQAFSIYNDDLTF